MFRAKAWFLRGLRASILPGHPRGINFSNEGWLPKEGNVGSRISDVGFSEWLCKFYFLHPDSYLIRPRAVGEVAIKCPCLGPRCARVVVTRGGNEHPKLPGECRMGTLNL